MTQAQLTPRQEQMLEVHKAAVAFLNADARELSGPTAFTGRHRTYGGFTVIETACGDSHAVDIYASGVRVYAGCWRDHDKPEAFYGLQCCLWVRPVWLRNFLRAAERALAAAV